jgi:hypothetical protein
MVGQQESLCVALTVATRDQAERIRDRVFGLLPPRYRKSDRLGMVVREHDDRVTAVLWLSGRELRDWEQGADEIVDVRAHVRQVRNAFGRPIAPVLADISAYRRRYRVAGHFVMDQAAAESGPAAIEAIAARIADALEE